MLGFIDYIIVFLRIAEYHAQRLENILQRFDEANLQLHPGKCEFAKSQVQYLGFTLSENGIAGCAEHWKL
jgi:hypothetical protein